MSELNGHQTAESTALATLEAPSGALTETRIADVFPDFAITLEEANRRVRMLQEYVRQHMSEGEDFGVIPGTSKPTLFKPGAEKLNAIFGLAPMMEVTNRLEDWERGFVAYEVKVTLINKRTGNVEAEGVGACNSAEKRYRTQDAANIANTILKMSKKRALIDATISATRASGLFTQDLEDLDLESGDGGQRSSQSRRQSGRSQHGRQPPRQQGAGQQQARQPDNALLTDAQHRAILAIGQRVFGHAPTAEDFATICDQPIDQLSKSGASALVDKLRAMMAEANTPSPRSGRAQAPAAVQPPPDRHTPEQYQQIQTLAQRLWGETWANELPRHAKSITSQKLRDFSRDEAQQLLDKLREFERAQSENVVDYDDDSDPFALDE